MAEIRNPISNPPVPVGRVSAPARVQAAREAQRAFFNAALAGETQAANSTAAASPAQATIKASPAAPDPRLRPGSIIDIKV